MEEQKSVVPVGVVRERVIETLTDAFANDLITVAELEDRLEKVYRATTADEAEALIAGLRPASAPQSGVTHGRREMLHEGERQRFAVILSANSRRGIWTVPRELDVFALFSDGVLDLSQASLPPDIVEIHVRVIMASMKIVVPAGTRVVNRVGAFVANVESHPSLDLAPMVPGSPVIRISGSAAFANLEIVAATPLNESR
jgi:hypothetical protein